MSAAVKQQQQQRSGAKAAAEEPLKTRDRLQAIVLGDSFERRFDPAALCRPPSLMPTPCAPALVDHALEWLSSSGVEDVFVACSDPAVATHVRGNPRWSSSQGLGATAVSVVESGRSVTVGDLLRDVFSRGLVTSTTGEFVVCFGDVVSNVDLSKVLAEHRARRAQDHSCVLTVVLAQSAPRHASRSLEDETLVVLDSATGQMLSYSCSPEESGVTVQARLLSKNKRVTVRYDLVECGVAVCSPEVVAELRENFDFKSITPDLLKGIMEIDADVQGHHAYAHIVGPTEYAYCARDLRTYHAVCRDLLQRWAYPVVPESPISPSLPPRTVSRNLVYKEPRVDCGRGVVLEREVIVGEGTAIGAGSSLKSTQLGRRCSIGARVVMTGCVLWDGVHIGDDVIISDSLLCDGAVVLGNATVSRGCVIGTGVVVGTGVLVPPFTKLAAQGCQTRDGAGTAPIDLGKDGRGVKWIDGEDVSALNTLVPTDDKREAVLTCYDSEAEEDESLDDEEDEVSSESERLRGEVYELVDMALSGACPKDEFHLQLRGLRMTYNSTSLNCGCLVLAKLFEISIVQQHENGQKPAECLQSLRAALEKWGAYVSPYVQGAEEEVQLIVTAKDVFRNHPVPRELFAMSIHAMYNSDLVSEDAVWSWVASAKQPDAPADSLIFLGLCEKFLEWLKTAEEEEEEEEDDD